MKVQSWLGVALAGVVAAGCARAREQKPILKDLGDGVDLYTEPPDLLKKSGFWAPCTTDSDCESQVCYKAMPTDDVGHCSKGCKNDCPDGYACETVRIDAANEQDLCIPAKQTLCNKCTSHRDCGDDDDMCIDIGGATFCSVNCAGNPGICPPGFECKQLGAVGELMNVQQCVPTNNICCIDKDGDGRGVGDGCITTDCDDTNKNIYDDATDICDGLDNDCKNGVDDKPINCKLASCTLGAFGYFDRAAEPCTSGACVMQSAHDCGIYTCSDGGEKGDHCATSCDGENDEKCIPTAHCDADKCIADLPDGDVCDEKSDCESDHCQNGFCCDKGDCCAMPSDCPGFGGQAPVCDDPSTCQGTRGDITCNNFRCGTLSGVPDDSACTKLVEADSCGFYRSIFCTGDTGQTAPSCPTACATHNDCDDNAFCDPSTHTCIGDLDNGQACATEDLRCKSGHCANGFCCATGDCCSVESDCPASYTSQPVCSVPTACQGVQDIARCENFQCSTEKNSDNDTACSVMVLASDCGSYLPIYCTGAPNQAAPVCPASCTSNSDCDADSYCNASSACVPDEPNGNACRNNDECKNAHCQNGFCCDSGDCCKSSANCTFLASAPQCMSQSTCQGQRVDGICTASYQCQAQVVQDDVACAGLQSNDCGPFPAVSCTSDHDQPADQASRCASSCTSDNGCDVSAHCTGSPAAPGTCAPDQGQGGFCNSPSECAANLFCVDHVCCNSACNGSCQACDLPNSVGVCSNVPDGQDPANECGAVGCGNYYAGYTGQTCFKKADVTAAQATCNGAGACRSVATECTNQTVKGAATNTCDTVCQSKAGCSGTTPGSCTNLNLGNLPTCGSGPCARTVAKCLNGVQQSCSPDYSKASTETCNGVDDNCDFVVDNGAFSDVYESNSSCSSYRTLNVYSNQTLYAFPTLYPSGDVDYFRIHSEESDNSCSCCDFFCTDEDFKLIVTLYVPAGAGSYQFCTNTSCGAVTDYCTTVYAGGNNYWSWTFDGGCPGNDGYDTYFRISPGNSPGYQCAAYTLKYEFQTGCF